MSPVKINAWVEELAADRDFWMEQSNWWREQALNAITRLGEKMPEAPGKAAPEPELVEYDPFA